MGGAPRHARASTTSCRSCAGTAARTSPRQAILVDLANGRFYFFAIELWPQEVYYVTGLLILAAFTLFLMNAVAGRVWCGYLCPQTVWTDLFMAVERLIEGDRRARIRLDAAPWTLEKFALKLLKHSVWLLIAWWTGGAWVLYFADAPTLVTELATFQAPPVAYVGDRDPDVHDLHACRPHARAGLHLHVPLAAHPGRAHRRALARRHLPIRPRRAPRPGEEERGAARQGAARRRLRRLRPVRRRLPGRHRHPRRPADGVHPVRPVRRRLQHRDGEGRPAASASSPTTPTRTCAAASAARCRSTASCALAPCFTACSSGSPAA